MSSERDYPPEAPLSYRMRPTTLDEFVGQKKILDRGKLLKQLIESDRLCSLILWGPPGSGKTSIASIIAHQTKAQFISFSAVTSSIKEVKTVMEQAKDYKRAFGTGTIIFVDEVHRFNKSQQDAFLPYIENGDIILIGATTENPSFELNTPLLSRSRVMVLNPLEEPDIKTILGRALRDTEKGLGRLKINMTDENLNLIAHMAGGDARAALNALEIAAEHAADGQEGKIEITREAVLEAYQKKAPVYDKKGEAHYDIISAFIKSMRNSDPDAALYWLARMLEGGEDPIFICRRMVLFASEDIGNADPQALSLANNVTRAVHLVGLPEGYLPLSQGVIYLSTCPKSNTALVAYRKAKDDVQKTGDLPVPFHLRNAPTRLMREMGYGKGYAYAHDMKEKTAAMPCRPVEVEDHVYCDPQDIGFEREIKKRLAYFRELRKKHQE